MHTSNINDVTGKLHNTILKLTKNGENSFFGWGDGSFGDAIVLPADFAKTTGEASVNKDTDLYQGDDGFFAYRKAGSYDSFELITV